MSNKKQKKNSKKESGSNNKNIQIIIGIICIILLFFGILEIDENGNLSFAENNVEETQTNTSQDNNSQETNIGNNAENNDVLTTETNEEDIFIYYLDVGQADSIFIYNNDETMLIDAGNNSDGKLICNYLSSLGITKIDYLVGTHPHEDHIGGLDDVINSFDVGTIYMPKKSATTKTFEDVLNAISDNGLKAKSPKIGSTFKVGNAICEVVSIDDNAEDANLSSICIEMTYGTQKYLFTGDMEKENEENIFWNDIDVLKVAHHGSSTSSSVDFLNQTNPEIAIISCGKDNDYGHPHKEIVKRLEDINCKIYRTDLLGTILLKSDGTTNELEFLDVSLDGEN